jgi:hypothetical protein
LVLLEAALAVGRRTRLDVANIVGKSSEKA